MYVMFRFAPAHSVSSAAVYLHCSPSIFRSCERALYSHIYTHTLMHKYVQICTFMNTHSHIRTIKQTRTRTRPLPPIPFSLHIRCISNSGLVFWFVRSLHRFILDRADRVRLIECWRERNRMRERVIWLSRSSCISVNVLRNIAICTLQHNTAVYWCSTRGLQRWRCHVQPMDICWERPSSSCDCYWRSSVYIRCSSIRVNFHHSNQFIENTSGEFRESQRISSWFCRRYCRKSFVWCTN